MNRTPASKWIAARALAGALVVLGGNCAASSSKTAVEATGGSTGSNGGIGSGGTGAGGALADASAQTVTGATLLYSGNDIVSYIDCTMDTHIAPVGWNVTGGDPPGANLRASAIAGWREYRSRTPGGALLDVSQRLGDPAPNGTAATTTSSGSPGGPRSCMAPPAPG